MLVKDISIELAKRGCVVKVISLHPPHSSFDQFPDRQEFLNKIEVEVLLCPLSLEVMLKGIKPKGIQQAVENFKPDIVHSHLFEAEIVSRSIDYPKARWFSHCHDNMWQLESLNITTLFKKAKLTAFLERTYLMKRYRKNGGNRFIAISKDTQRYFNRVLPSDLRSVTLLSNAVNTKRFAKPATYEHKRMADLELVTVGSLADKKNQTFLLDVVKRLAKKHYKVHLHILGDGKNRQALEEKTMRLKIGDSVTFHGNVPNVEEFLWNSDIYVHAATYEPFGLVLVEAMAAGLPVVSLDGRGNRDIIQDQKNGYILSEPDVVDFANKVALLFHDKFKYEQMKQAAIETAKQFDIVNYTDKLLALYQKALKEK